MSLSRTHVVGLSSLRIAGFWAILHAVSVEVRSEIKSAPPSSESADQSNIESAATTTHAFVSPDDGPILSAGYQLLTAAPSGPPAPRDIGDNYDIAVLWSCSTESNYVTDTGGGPGPCMQLTFDTVTETCGSNTLGGSNVEVLESLNDNGDGTVTVTVQASTDDGTPLVPTGLTCTSGRAINQVTMDLAKQDAGGPGIPGDPLDPGLSITPFDVLEAEAIVFGSSGQVLTTATLTSSLGLHSVLKNRFVLTGVNSVAVPAIQFRYRIAADIPAGACCLPDGGCLDDVTHLECSLPGGQYFGDLSLCIDFPCGPEPLICLTLPGDLSGDSSVSGDDIPGFIECAIGGGADCDCADMTFDNTIDDDDTPLFVAALLELDIEYSTPIGPLPAIITTDAGDQPATVQGHIRFSAGAPDSAGVRALTLEQLVLGTTSAATASSETGGMTFLLRPGTGTGTWDLESGDFTMAWDFDAGFWLLNETVTEKPLVGPQEDVEEKQREFWGGFLTATAALGQGIQSVELDGELTSDVITSITNSVTGLTVPLQGVPVGVPTVSAPGCPDEKKCKKRMLCLQPVFVRTDAGANPAGSSLAVFQAAADSLWARCCVEFDWQDAIFVDETDYLIIEKSDLAEGRQERDNLRAEVDPRGTNDCIEIFFVEKFVRDNGNEHASGDGVTVSSGLKAAKVIVADAAIDDCNPDITRVLAHELGHVMNQDHPSECIMTPGGNSQNCPANNPNKVKLEQCKSLTNPLLKEKNPEEACCKDPNCS